MGALLCAAPDVEAMLKARENFFVGEPAAALLSSEAGQHCKAF